MIDWVDEMCKSWGSHESRSRHQISAGVASTLGRIKEEWEGASQQGKSAGGQRFPEVRVGDNLKIHRALREPTPMPYRLFATIYAHYAVVNNARRNIVVLSEHLQEEMTLSDYWRAIDAAHYFLSARLEPPARSSSPTRKRNPFSFSSN